VMRLHVRDDVDRIAAIFEAVVIETGRQLVELFGGKLIGGCEHVPSPYRYTL